MRFCCAVLIAAVTVNCLVTAINGKTASNAAIEPFNMLLPPLEDKPEDAVKTTKAPSTTTTTAPTAAATKPTKSITTTKRTATTTKPLANNVKNVLPELSIEALLPPLFDAKIEKAEETEHKQPSTHTATQAAISTSTTTERTTTTTTTKRTTVATVKPIDNYKIAPSTATSQTTKKSYEQQPAQQHLIATPAAQSHNYQKQQPQSKVATKPLNKDKQQKQVSKPLPQHIISNIEELTTKQVVKQVAERKLTDSYNPANYNNYSFDFYLGSTTPRPPKHGLPTITPFPHRLGR